MKTIGIVGYGHLGKYLCERILNEPTKFKLQFIWNRSPILNAEHDPLLKDVEVLNDLNEFKKFKTDIIIEVAHPIISENYGEKFLQNGSDYMIGSPTALADEYLCERLVKASFKYQKRILVPCGAFWGATDIRKMSDKSTLKGLKITMKKHPVSLKLEGSLKNLLDSKLPLETSLVIYEGSVRELSKLAPNNVNTMAVGALCAQNLGFDKVQACLIADPDLTDKHLIEIEVIGPYNEELKQNFHVLTVRSNPAIVGHVTGMQTYASFFNSLLETLDDYNRFGIKVC